MVFRVAGVGLILGVIILLLSWKRLERADRRPDLDPNDAGFGAVLAKILLPALITGVAGYLLANTFFPDFVASPATIGFVVGMIPVLVFFIRLPSKSSGAERKRLWALLPIYAAGGTFFMVLHLNGSAMTQWADDQTDRAIPAPSLFQQDALPSYYGNAAEDIPRPNRDTLIVVEDPGVARMYGQKRMDEQSLAAILESHPGLEVREFEATALATEVEADEAELLHFATKIYEDGAVEIKEGKDAHGSPTVSVELTGQVVPQRQIAFMRDGPDGPFAAYVIDQASYDVVYGGYEDQFGHPPEELPPGEWVPVINAELFQSLNALFVIGFTPLVVFFFGWLAGRREVTTARRVFYGLCLTTASLLLMALAGIFADGGAAKVSGLWLVGFYAIITLGELLISPMGLSLVTKLSPKRLVGLAMGGWFLATAFGNKFSGFFGGIQSLLSPEVFFLVLAGIAATVAVFIRVLLPKLDDAIAEVGG
jgi:dipeptide/tripeptide permease